MFSTMKMHLFFTLLSMASCHGYRNKAGDVAYIDELISDGESNTNSIIQNNQDRHQKKRSLEESIFDTSVEDNDDDIMAVQSANLNNNNNNNNVEYTYHQPSASNSLETDDLMTVASPPLITESQKTKDSSLIIEDIMTHIANERKDELTARATEPEKKLSANVRDKRSKTPQKNTLKRAKLENLEKGDLNSIFSEMQTSKHHKLTRSDIRKLAKQAVMIATIKKLEQVKNSKKSSVNKSKKDSKHNNNNNKNNNIRKKKKKEDKQQKKDNKHKTSKSNKEKSEMKMTQNEFEMAENLEETSSKRKKIDNQKENTETPGTDQGKKINVESSDGKETKDEVVAENLDLKNSNTATSKNNKTIEINASNKNKKSKLSISGNDMATNVETVADVIQNSKDASNKTSEFSEDLTAMNKNSPNFDELSDDALFNAISKTSTPELDNSSLITTTTSSTTTTSPTTPSPTTSTTQPLNTNTTPKESIDVMNNTETETLQADNLRMPKDKKSTIAKPTSQMEEEILNVNTDNAENKTKKSKIPSESQIKSKIKKLKEIIAKSTPDKIPDQFLPDLPSGLRMIAWKQLLEKKKKQLSELVSSFTTDNIKPVTININIDPDKSEAVKKQITEQPDSGENVLLDTKTGEKKTATPLNDETNDSTNADPTNSVAVKPDDQDSSDKTKSEIGNENPKTEVSHDKTKPDDINSHHVKYLQGHLKDARSLRKLIAKTLIGHCKSTGKRILEAFIAMDKALERAQAIAEVIGNKFHVNPERIEALVGDKEDEVVETFLRDIFTKL